MIDFSKVMGETKTHLKNLINKDSSQDEINRITAIDKQLDQLQEAFTEKSKENESLKDDLIASVKSTSFKVNSSNENDDIDGNQKSMDEILSEELNKITSQKGGK